MNLIEQEVSTQRWIDIPEGVLDLLYRWRPWSHGSERYMAGELENISLSAQEIAESRKRSLEGHPVPKI